MRPVELTGIVNRTPDYAQLKQNEDQKQDIEQTAIQTQNNKQEERISDTDVKKHDSEWKYEKLDAKEKGKNKYFGSSGKKKENKGEDDKSAPGRHTSFDVRI